MDKYVFFHKRANGTRTEYVERVMSLSGDEAAVHAAILIAREVKADGLSGTIECEGSGKTYGHNFSIPLADIDSVPDPLKEVIEDEVLDGYERVMEIFDFLWPWEGDQKVPQPLHFLTLNGGIEVSCSRPRGCLVVYTVGDEKYEVYHMGPSLTGLMSRFTLTEAEARKIWQETLDKLEAMVAFYA